MREALKETDVVDMLLEVDIIPVVDVDRAKDLDAANVTVGAAISLIQDLPLAKDRVRTITSDAIWWAGAAESAAAQAAG